ncbi:unnamed protein product [Ectocarpus sp. CCAP 1310/34]|nr:unnamed protein product [Ectocarpus sp. CCAP 1310/34]
MAPPIAIESEEHLQRLVQENDKLIAGRFPVGEDDDPTTEEAFEQLPAAAEGGLALLCRIDPGSIPAANLLPDGWETSEGDHQEPCWFFYSAGKMVYAAQDSATPGPKLGRLAALLERSPDTLHQLARQDQVLRRQRRGQQPSSAAAAAAADASADEDDAVVAAPLPQERGRHGAARGEQLLGVTPEGAEREGGVPASGPGPAVLVFVAGDRSQAMLVGKSTTCLGLLGSLLRRKDLCSSDLAYIKPATQCEKLQPVTDWCEANGVACRGIGPVVFYKGFTREFLKGGAGTSEELLQEIRDAVEEISSGKKVVVVDGVGYPAVGSICGVSNGDVAAALKAPVLLVGKSGVGDAVDSYNLNACFFEARGVRVLGGVFNRISTTGYYSLERCREAVTSYFAQANPNALPYGFVPEIASLKHASAAGSVAAKPGVSQAEANSTAVRPAPAGAPAQTEVAQGEGGGAGSGIMTGLSDSPKEKESETARVKEKLPATEVEDEQDLQAYLATTGSERLVLVDFGAEWCKNCKAILPLVRSLPERFDGAVAVATADVDKAAELADERKVTTIPHFVLLKNGVQVDTYTGSSETDLLSKLAQHLPDVGTPATEPSPAGSGPAGTGSSGAMIRSGPGEHVKGVNGEDIPGEKSAALKAAEALIDAFDGNVDVARLLRDIRQHAAEACGDTSSNPSRRLLPPPPPLLPRAPGETPIQTTKAAAGSSSGQPWAVSAAAAVVQQQQGPTVEDGRRGEKQETSGSDSSVTATKPAAAAAAAAVSATRKSRQEVEAEATKLGASGG